MGIRLEIFDAAHQYGLDNMDVDGISRQINKILLGEISTITSSWSGSLLPGHSGEFTIVYSNGFTVKQRVENIDGSNGRITEESIYHTATNTLLQFISGEILFEFPIGNASFDLEVIYADNDVITGNSHNNRLRGFKGNDVLDGKGGVDTVQIQFRHCCKSH